MITRNFIQCLHLQKRLVGDRHGTPALKFYLRIFNFIVPSQFQMRGENRLCAMDGTGVVRSRRLPTPSQKSCNQNVLDYA